MTSRQGLRGRLATLLPREVASLSPIGGGDICDAYRVALTDGDEVFAKTLPDAPAGFFAAEADGLRLLDDALPRDAGAHVPRVRATAEDVLVLDWVEAGSGTPAGADGLGRALAAIHRTPAACFGTSQPAFLGSLPLLRPETPYRQVGDWPEFHSQYRLLPTLRLAVDRGAVAGFDQYAVEQLCARLDELAGPARGPAVVHGDLWSGNVHFDRHGRAWLIDPSAQGGHPEADLAMLRLFGAPLLSHVLAAYDEESPPAEGRDARVPLHQLHPLLVHAALFGGGYGAAAGRAARQALTDCG